MTTSRLTAIPALLTLALAAASCAGGSDGDRPIPRRAAYPRIQIPDSVFSASDSLPMSLQVSDAAVTELSAGDDGSVWVTVKYPGLNASIYYTFTPATATTVGSVIDNRSERIALNLGSAEAESLSFALPGGIDCDIITDRAGRASTPVQFIATDHHRFVVSGAAYIADAGAPPDSIAPIIAMLRRDITHSLKTLRP